MNYRSILRAMVVMMVFGQATVTACLLEPPLKDVENGTLSGDAGQTLTFSGTGKFYCPDGGQITGYRWVLPAQAYGIEGDDTATMTCKFSPGGASYEVELQVMCSHNLWNTEHVNYTSTNRFIYAVTVSTSTGLWYVSPDGSDSNDGQSWQNAFRTIQTAIDSAISGQTIYIKSGSAESPIIYYEHLDLKGKNLTIISETPDDWEAVENTIIHADQRGTGVVFQGTERGTFKGFTVTGAAPKGDELALHLTFDDESNPGEDSSGKERDSTSYNSPAWSSAGYDGGMLTFDGVDDYLNVEGYAGIVGRGARTCSAWVKVSGTKATPYAVLSWGKDITSDTKFVFGLTSTGKVCVYTCYFGIFGNSVLNDGNWHHIAAVIESSGDPTLRDVKLYADGVLQTPSFAGGTGAASAPINTEIGDFLIGAYDYEGTTGLGAWHQGSLDDVKLYSRALTEGQIQAQVFTGPIAHWALDEESGTQANDSSGNNQIGMLNGDVSRVDGRVSRAIHLDGDNDYVQIQDSANFAFTGAFTLVAWAKPATDLSGSGRVIYQYDDASQDGILLSYENTAWRFGICIDGSSTAKFAYSDAAPQKEAWTHLVGRRNSNGLLELFVNGVKQSITETFSGTVDSSGSLYLGVDYALNCDFKGDLDDIRVYNRALTDAEIQVMADDERLIAKWALDRDVNDSVGVHHGTNNGAVLTADGILDAAAQFDGSDYIEVGGYSGILGSDSRTISAWIKQPVSDTTASEMICAWGKLDYSDQAKGYGLFTVGNVLGVGLCGPYMCGTTNIRDNKWHYVAAVLYNDGSPVLGEVKLFIDGKLEPMNPFSTMWQYYSTPIGTEPGNLTIGAGKFSPSNTFDLEFIGLIDDVRLYNFALSDGQIQHVYQSRFAEGGGMKGRGTLAAVEKCIFKDNVSEANGGGLSQVDGSVKNCLFIRNASNQSGGAISEAAATLENCTFVNNSALSGGALYSCSGQIVNNIAWGNLPNQYVNSSWVSYNCVQDWSQSGTGNISHNPYFYNASTDNYRLLLSSPCIDAGDPTSDYSQEPDPNGLRINLGAYGNTSEAATTVQDRENYDTDQDGIPDGWEIQYGLNPLVNDAGQPSLGSGGLLTNLQEYQNGTNPTLMDSDADGLPDWWEILYGLAPLNPDDASQTSANSDGRLTNLEEYWAGTDPTKLSTVDDDLPDWWKIKYRLDPFDSNLEDLDSDKDGLTNLEEFEEGTHPLHHNAECMVIEYEYDNYGRLWKQTTHDGQPESIVYGITEYAFDELGRQWQERKYKDADADNIQEDMVTLTGYDVQGNAILTVHKTDTSTDAATVEDGDIVVLNKYSATGRLDKSIQGVYLETVDPDDDNIQDPKTTEYVYLNEQLYQVKAPKHGITELDRAVTTYYYDVAGRTWKVVEATGHYRQTKYDSFGQVIKETYFASDDTPHMQKRYEFDELGRLLRDAVMASASALDTQAIQTDTDRVTDYYYDTDGVDRHYPGYLVAKTIYFTEDGVPATMLYDYDELEREIFITDPDENYKSVAYDDLNRIYHVVEFFDNPVTGRPDLMQSTRYYYDSSGRLQQIIQEPNPLDDSTWRYTVYHYDAADRKRKEVKPNGVETSFDYDGWGNVTDKIADSAVGGKQQTTIWTYDRLGRQHTITGYTGVGTSGTAQTTTYSYTDLNKVGQITYPDDETIAYDYYDNGMVYTRTDQRDLVTTYAYDATGTHLLTKTVTQSGVITVESFTYDALGRMDTAAKTQDSSPISYSDFAYYDSGLLQSEQQTLFGGTPRTVSYAYDPAGYRRQTTYPQGTVIDRVNTWDGRIDNLLRNSTSLVEYEYVGPHVARRTYPYPDPDILADYLYDTLGRLDAIEVGALAGFVYGYASMEDNIETMTYTHRANDPINTFGYDDLDRLTGVEYLSNAQDVEDFSAMDNVGNRIGQVTQRDGVHSYAVDGLTNRYTAIDSVPLDYDLAGNLTQDQDGYRYDYDYENRITRIFEDVNANEVYDSGIDGNIAEFAYDALARRIMKHNAVASETTYYYYSDNWQVLAEYDGSGIFQAYYLFGNYIDEVLLMHRDEADKYYLHDHLYSPVALLDDDGDVVERYEYDAYGKLTVWNPTFTTTYPASQYGNPYAFTGRELDKLDNGGCILMHYRHRAYNPDAGRFMQQDPLNFINTVNLSEYVKSNPVVYVDNRGLFSIDVIGTPAYYRDYCLDGEPRGKGCISSFWMSVALRPTSEEKNELHSVNGGFSVLRKLAKWRQFDCDTGEPREFGHEEATFLKLLPVDRNTGGILDTGAAGAGATGITDMVSFDQPKQIYISPYYSALISKTLKEPRSKCCSRGEMSVAAEFYIYPGPESVMNDIYTPSPNMTISQEEYGHVWWSAPGRARLDSLSPLKPISKGMLRVDIKWDCENNVTATARSNVPYSSTGNLTRSGNVKEQQWREYRTDLQAGISFPIPF